MVFGSLRFGGARFFVGRKGRTIYFKHKVCCASLCEEGILAALTASRFDLDAGQYCCPYDSTTPKTHG